MSIGITFSQKQKSNQEPDTQKINLGQGLITNDNKITLGFYNKPNKNNIIEIGSGKSDSQRQNSIEILKSGIVKLPKNTIYQDLPKQGAITKSILERKLDQLNNEYFKKIEDHEQIHIKFENSIEEKIQTIQTYIQKALKKLENKILDSHKKTPSEIAKTSEQIQALSSTLDNSVEDLQQKIEEIQLKLDNIQALLEKHLKDANRKKESSEVKIYNVTNSTLNIYLPDFIKPGFNEIKLYIYTPDETLLQMKQGEVYNTIDKIYIDFYINLGVDMVSSLSVENNTLKIIFSDATKVSKVIAVVKEH